MGDAGKAALGGRRTAYPKIRAGWVLTVVASISGVGLTAVSDYNGRGFALNDSPYA